MSEVPYVGCKISLISKSEIRYEGTLNTINSTDATVTLENVRSFGSEGRRGGNKEIQPSPQVYELIVFRGTDIKDLTVCEVPKYEPKPQVQPSYPPVVEESFYKPPATYDEYATINQQPFFTPLYYESAAVQPPMGYEGFSFPNAAWPSYQQQQPYSSAPSQYGYNPYFQQPIHPYPFAPEPESPLHMLHDQLSKTSFDSLNQAIESSLEDQPAPIPTPQPVIEKTVPKQVTESKPAAVKQFPTPKVASGKPDGNVENTNNIPRQPRSMMPQQPNQIKDFYRHQIQNTEFDFEKSNSRLQKSAPKLSAERNEPSLQERRAKFQHEKATNIETFGIASSGKRYPVRRGKYLQSGGTQNRTSGSSDAGQQREIHQPRRQGAGTRRNPAASQA